MSDIKEIEKAVRDKTISPEQALAAYELPGRHISAIECAFEVEPLKCGFKAIEDRLYLRKNRPDLSVIAARPGHGKTSLVCQIALNVSKHSNVLVFSLEMGAASLKERFLAVELDKPLKKLNLLTKEQVQAVNKRLESYRLVIDDTNSLHINEIVSRARARHKISPLSLVVVDYIQIVRTNGLRSKAEEVNLIAEQLKTLAKELNCPILAVAQNNRNIDGRGSYVDYKSGELKRATNTRPLMSDLADASGIEKWADFIAFIDRPFLTDRTRPGEADIFVVKNRNGVVDDFVLAFSGELTKFFDYQGGL
jgi:replicative DNA helicase